MVSITNGKGGVGKTSITANLAGHAAAAGWRTLTVDLDPQGDLGEDLGYRHDEASDEGLGLHDAVLRNEPVAVLKQVRGRPHLDSIPGGQWTARLSRTLRDERLVDGLERALATVAGNYDLVLVDTPPDMESEALRQAVGASRWLIVPTGRDNSSVRGIERVEQVRHAAQAAGSGVEMLGVVMFNFGRNDTRIVHEIREAVEGGGVRVFDSFIRHNRLGTMQMRDEGRLTAEYDQTVETALAGSNRYQAGQDLSLAVHGRHGDGLAHDYHRLAAEVLGAITARPASTPAPTAAVGGES